jgi:hypothetical protein
VILSLLGARARQSGDLAVLREFARTLSYVGLRVFTPAVLMVLDHSDMNNRHVAGRRLQVTGCLPHAACDMFT